MFSSKIFSGWFVFALCVWVGLFSQFNTLAFLQEHWYYPAVMVVGAFVAGLTPEGGGAVAFPVLNVFLNIDRVLARDFSLMIQSIGMTSASIFILTHRDTIVQNFKPMLWFVPVCFTGFVIGMLTLQTIPVYIIQALFLSLITTFVIAYVLSDHRGTQTRPDIMSRLDYVWLTLILILGGMCASLFGTGADIILYTLLTTRFGMKEKHATHFSIILMAAISVLGYAYRGLVDQGLSAFQIQTWLNAYPVVLFMAPFGAFMLTKINVEWMLRGVIVLNIGQLLYFNINKPSVEKMIVSAIFSLILGVIFYLAMRHISRKNKAKILAAENPAAISG